MEDVHAVHKECSVSHHYDVQVHSTVHIVVPD